MKVRQVDKNLIGLVKSEALMSVEYIKHNITAAAELRISFIMQVIGMMLNDISFLIVWLVFIKAFGNVNSWGSAEVIALQGFVAIIYGFTFAFFAGVSELPNVINTGAFDGILLTPRNLYFRILTLVTTTSAIGDILYGIILFIVYIILGHLSLTQILLFSSLLIPATLITTNFALVTACIGFFIPDSQEVARYTFEIMFGPSLYPAGVFQGWMRFIFLYVIPTLAIAGLPIEAVKSLDIYKVVIIWILAIAWSFITFLVLYIGVRKYESGNLTGARI